MIVAGVQIGTVIVLDEIIICVTYLAVCDNIINRIQLINMNYLPHDTRRYIQRNNVIIIIIHINYDIIFGASKNQRKWFHVNRMHTVPYTITIFYGRVEIMFLAGIKHIIP